MPRAAYDERSPHVPSVLLEECARDFAGCRRVLDLGCGANLLKASLPQALGVDASRHARADVLADITRLPFRGGSVEGVVAKNLLERLPEPWATVEEIHRVLAPGGRLRVEVPTPHDRGFWDVTPTCAPPRPGPRGAPPRPWLPPHADHGLLLPPPPGLPAPGGGGRGDPDQHGPRPRRASPRHEHRGGGRARLSLAPRAPRGLGPWGTLK